MCARVRSGTNTAAFHKGLHTIIGYQHESPLNIYEVAESHPSDGLLLANVSVRSIRPLLVAEGTRPDDQRRLASLLPLQSIFNSPMQHLSRCDFLGKIKKEAEISPDRGTMINNSAVN